MKHPEKNNRKHAWTHSEDSTLMEAVEITGNKDERCYRYLQGIGFTRSYHAVCNRIRYLAFKQAQVEREFSLPAGWGYY